MNEFVLSIDPGELHCGVAWSQGPEVVKTVTWAPAMLFDYLEGYVDGTQRKPEVLVYESYHLYPWLLQEQGFSEVLTAQHIGVIRYLAAKARIHIKPQPASIKKPTRAQCARRKIEVPGATTHERDAALHGIYHHFNPKGNSPK